MEKSLPITPKNLNEVATIILHILNQNKKLHYYLQSILRWSQFQEYKQPLPFKMLINILIESPILKQEFNQNQIMQNPAILLEKIILAHVMFKTLQQEKNISNSFCQESKLSQKEKRLQKEEAREKKRLKRINTKRIKYQLQNEDSSWNKTQKYKKQNILKKQKKIKKNEKRNPKTINLFQINKE